METLFLALAITIAGAFIGSAIENGLKAIAKGMK